MVSSFRIVTAALVLDGCRLLLARRGDGLWEFPGGTLEAGESLRGCLLRELWEELGVKASVGSQAAVLCDLEAGLCIWFFDCELAGTPSLSEHVEVGFFTPAQASKLSLPGLDRRLVCEMLS